MSDMKRKRSARAIISEAHKTFCEFKVRHKETPSVVILYVGWKDSLLTHYLENITPRERAKITSNTKFTMLGLPIIWSNILVCDIY